LQTGTLIMVLSVRFSLTLIMVVIGPPAGVSDGLPLAWAQPRQVRRERRLARPRYGEMRDPVFGAVVPAAPDRLIEASLPHQFGDHRIHLGTGELGPAQYPRRLHRVPGFP
jgi:hypothetical protein